MPATKPTVGARLVGQLGVGGGPVVSLHDERALQARGLLSRMGASLSLALSLRAEAKSAARVGSRKGRGLHVVMQVRSALPLIAM